jgi:DNA-binding transcriptional regulator YiaG
LTQEEFAKALSPPVSTQTVKLWEWGKFKPSGRSLTALATKFGVSVKTLLDEYEEWKNESDQKEAGS